MAFRVQNVYFSGYFSEVYGKNPRGKYLTAPSNVTIALVKHFFKIILCKKLKRLKSLAIFWYPKHVYTAKIRDRNSQSKISDTTFDIPGISTRSAVLLNDGDRIWCSLLRSETHKYV